MTITGARAALVAALAGAGIGERVVNPPAALVFFEGLDVARMVRSGAAPARFRVELVVGKYDPAAAPVATADAVQAALGALVALDGWAIDSVGPDRISEWAGGLYYTVSIVTGAYVDL